MSIYYDFDSEMIVKAAPDCVAASAANNYSSYYATPHTTPPPPRPRRTCSVVLLGETGAGKSSVVNALGLMSQQITIGDLPCVITEQENKMEDDDWGCVGSTITNTIIDLEHEKRVHTFLQDTFSHCVIPSSLTRDLNLFTEKEHNESLITGASQTLKPKIFHFDYHRKNYDFHLKVIDTPGMGDTRGNDQDVQNITMILDHLCTVDDLGGIVLVLNGTVSRVNASVVNVVNKLKSILPACIFQTCFYLLFTNTNSCGANYNTDWLFPELEQKPKVISSYIIIIIIPNSFFIVPLSLVDLFLRKQQPIFNDAGSVEARESYRKGSSRRQLVCNTSHFEAAFSCGKFKHGYVNTCL